MRPLIATLILCLSCASGGNRPPAPQPASSGGSGAPTGGSGGVPGLPGGGTVGISTGGTPAVADAAPDAPVVVAAPDAGASPSDAVTVTDGRYWLHWCQPEWPKAQCCAFYCDCMKTTCPGTLPASCQTACESGNWNLKCRVEQCFEANNPGYPMDKGSHCGHAVEKPPKCQGLTP
jgi:hypothetical protein